MGKQDKFPRGETSKLDNFKQDEIEKLKDERKGKYIIFLPVTNYKSAFPRPDKIIEPFFIF